MSKVYDAVVVGAGHAGIESALALAKLGHKTLVVTLSLNAIGFMACNPNVGGTAKGHLVREMDALGGTMGRIADKATIQTRMLNLGNGAAVHSLRNQVDKDKYHRLMKNELEKEKNLTVLEGEIEDILYENGEIKGVKTSLGDIIYARAVVLCTGVYLRSQTITGEHVEDSGPSGYKRSSSLSDALNRMGLPVRRFKTGTPPRVLRSTCDFTRMEEQRGDEGIYPFSDDTDYNVENDYLCYLTYTNPLTHGIILDNLDRSPLYNGSIKSVGPRYCPSIETKIVRFKDKERHQIFIEPEGADTDEMYVQGLSTSMPFDVQEQMVHSIVGLENAAIMRYGYAIEYDCVDPLALLPTLEYKAYKGLFGAGQINGSSGYEEAGAQGLMAGINAARYLENKPPVILGRDQAYIGVLIDDLVTKGTNEPYRMMTSRAEYRLQLRQDNADLRLTEIGREIGLIDEKRYKRFLEKVEIKGQLFNDLKKHYSPEQCAEVFNAKNEEKPRGGISGEEILRRTNIDYRDLEAIDGQYSKYGDFLLQQTETEIKYEGYLNKQKQAIREMRKMEEKVIPADINYDDVISLRVEARQKLNEIRPLTLAQAGRISGVNPADIMVLLIYLEKK